MERRKRSPNLAVANSQKYIPFACLLPLFATPGVTAEDPGLISSSLISDLASSHDIWLRIVSLGQRWTSYLVASFFVSCAIAASIRYLLSVRSGALQKVPQTGHIGAARRRYIAEAMPDGDRLNFGMPAST